MGKDNYHVVPNGDKWAVRKEGSTRATKTTETQKEAIDVARESARKNESELIIHGRNGRIRQKDSYGNDSYPPKG